jgi:hypothetical protein
MKYVIVKPSERAIDAVDAKEPHELYERAGLEPLKVDHGIIGRATNKHPGLAIIVHEYSLFVDPAQQHYFAFGSKLFAGNAILYSFDEAGDTIDVLPAANLRGIITWFRDRHAVEMAIRAGHITRPRLVVDGVTKWQWPERQPPLTEEAKEKPHG